MAKRYSETTTNWGETEIFGVTLKIGSQVTFAIEVSDHYPVEEGHLRRSTTRKLTIVDPERYLEWHRSKLAAQIEEMRRVQESEQVSSTKVGELRDQEDESKETEE